MNWQTLGQALYRVLRSRDLLITLADPQLNEPLHLAQLDGALRADAGDHVMVVDTNMGFNKASVAMQQAMQYTVTLAADRAPQAELTIAYTNTNPLVPGCASRSAHVRSGYHLRRISAAMLLAVPARAGSAGRQS